MLVFQLVHGSGTVKWSLNRGVGEKAEVDESEFWLEFIIDEELVERDRVLPLLREAHELASIFIVSRRTAQKNTDDL
jgi:hypothetical protein